MHKQYAYLFKQLSLCINNRTECFMQNKKCIINYGPKLAQFTADKFMQKTLVSFLLSTKLTLTNLQLIIAETPYDALRAKNLTMIS